MAMLTVEGFGDHWTSHCCFTQEGRNQLLVGDQFSLLNRRSTDDLLKFALLHRR